jgi:uncharacterized membrane protein
MTHCSGSPSTALCRHLQIAYAARSIGDTIVNKSHTDPLRIRRHEPTRLEGFVDASFAFAVTLLVISIGHVPASVPEMLHAFRGASAFALSFLVVARFWKAHRDWSRHYDIEDGVAVTLSLILVFIVLVFVYPLRFIFSLLFKWLSHDFLVDQPIALGSIDEYRVAFEIYGTGFAAIAAVFVSLYWHAWRRRVSVGLDRREELATRMHATLWTALCAIALASAIAAAILPFENARSWLFTVPGGMYALMGFAGPAIRRHYAQRMAWPG